VKTVPAVHVYYHIWFALMIYPLFSDRPTECVQNLKGFVEDSVMVYLEKGRIAARKEQNLDFKQQEFQLEYEKLQPQKDKLAFRIVMEEVLQHNVILLEVINLKKKFY